MGKLKVREAVYIYFNNTSGNGLTANITAPTGNYTFAYNSLTYVYTTGGNNYNWYLRYNSSRFRFYSGSTTGAPIRLYKLDAQYTVTCNTPTNGLLSSNKLTASQGETVTLSVTPNSGYELSALTVTNSSTSATISTSGSGTSYTFTMPNANVEVSATFITTTTKDIVFNVPSCVTQPSTLTGKATGATVTLPTEPTGTPDGYTFVGWTTGICDGVSTQPTTYTGGSSYTIPSGASNVNLYALYSEGGFSIGTGSFTRITDTQGLTTGWSNLTMNTYYIISNINNTLLLNSLSGNRIAADDNRSNDATYTITNINLVYKLDSYVKGGTTYYRLRNLQTGTYVAATGTAGQATLIADGENDKALWSIQSTSNGYKLFNKYNTANSVNAYLGYNSTSVAYGCYGVSYGGAELYIYKANTNAVANNTTYTTDPACYCEYRIMKSINSGSTWTEDGCFVKVAPNDDTDYEWQLANYELPSNSSDILFKIQENGSDKSGQTASWQYGSMPLAELQNTSCTTKAFDMEGAVGTLRIYSNSSDANSNFYVGFLPTYQICHEQDGSNDWVSETFEYVSGTADTYETAITTAPTGYYAGNYQFYVGLQKADGSTKFVSGKSNTQTMKTMGGMTTDVGGRSGVYRMYANSCDNNWYCQFVPYYVVYYHDVNGNEIEEWRDILTSSSTTIHAYATSQTGWATTLGGSANATYNAGNSITPTGDLHLYQVAPTYTITFSVASETSSVNGTTMKAIQGQSITLPTITFSCGLYDTFVGWVTGSDIAELDPAAKIDEPSTLVGAGGASYTPTGNVTLKALYGYDCSGNSGWQKQTSISAGRYVIVASTYGFSELESAVNSTTNQGLFVSNVTITNDVINNVTGMHEVEVILGAGGAFAIKYQDGNYMENSGGYFNGNITTLASAYRWKLNASGQIYDAATSGADTYYLQINNSNHKFKCYKGTQTNYAFLYRYTKSGYYTTNPTCSTPTDLTVTFVANSPTGNNADVTNMPNALNSAFSSYPTLSRTLDFSSNNTPTCTGYTIQKWNTAANGSGTDYALDATISSYMGSTLILYAVWERTYTVTFNDQGTITERTQASGGASVRVPGHTASCDGSSLGITWTFAGWSTTASMSNSLTPNLVLDATTGAANADYIPTADITLYAVYARTTTTSDAFTEGVSGAYYLSAVNSSGIHSGETCHAQNKTNAGYISDVTIPATKPIVYFTYQEGGTYAGYYTIQSADGQYAYATATSGSFAWKNETSANTYLKATAVSGGYQFEWWINGSASGSYFTHDSRFGQFKGAGDPLILTSAPTSTYYTTMSCSDTYNMTFSMSAGAINWASGYPEGTYLNKSDGTVISTFPTATLDGWTFVGWTAGNQYNSLYSITGLYSDIQSGITDPVSSPVSSGAVYGGVAGTSYTMHNDIVMYPVFTRFADNEPFDNINGGKYFMYYTSTANGYKDGFYSLDGMTTRIYAKSYTSGTALSSTTTCSNAQLFSFEKRADGNWDIRLMADEDTYRSKSYMTNASGNDFSCQTTQPSYGWIIADKSEAKRSQEDK